MSAVDVIDAAINKVRQHAWPQTMDLEEARAAVSELIEAAEGVRNTPRPAGSDPNGRYSKAEKRLAAALANIGAAP